MMSTYLEFGFNAQALGFARSYMNGLISATAGGDDDDDYDDYVLQ